MLNIIMLLLLKFFIGLFLLIIIMNIIIFIFYMIKLYHIRIGETITFTNIDESDPFTYLNSYKVNVLIINKTYYSVTYMINNRIYTSIVKDFFEQDYSKFTR